MSPGSKLLLHMWVLIVKRNMNPEGDHYELEHMFDESEKEPSLFDESVQDDEEDEVAYSKDISGLTQDEKGTGSKSPPS